MLEGYGQGLQLARDEVGQDQMEEGLESGEWPALEEEEENEENEENEEQELIGKEFRQKRRFRGKLLRRNPNKIMIEVDQLYPSLGKNVIPFWLPTSSMGARGKKSNLGDWTRISKRDSNNNRNKRDWTRISKRDSNNNMDKRDWTRISKRGRETEGSWHPYKRDPMYRCNGVTACLPADG